MQRRLSVDERMIALAAQREAELKEKYERLRNPHPAPAEAPASSVDFASHPAGGSPNNRFSLSRALDFGIEEPRRRLRRSLSAPRSLGSRTARASEFVEPMQGPAGALMARHDALSGARAPQGGFTTSSHDKSIPNKPRSQRASGQYQPKRPLQVTPDALAAAPYVLVSDSGFDSSAVGRRARGSCSPMACRPTADPNQHVAERLPAAEAPGLGSSLSKTVLSPSRRALGACSPVMGRSGSAAALALQWD